MGYQPMGHLLLDTTLCKYVAVMLIDVGEGFRHMGSRMRVTGRQVSRWPLKFYLPQGQHEIFQPWRSANGHALPPGLTELEQLYVEPTHEHSTF